MLRLVKAGLIGQGLLRIETEELVRRYNNALERVGIKPTALKSFQIDAIGWSPEIATEKNDPFYLLAGGVNQFVVIITPDQGDLPIYASYTSFLQRLVREYYERWRNEIADITTTHALTLTIDPELSRYKSPLDLLQVKQVIAHTDADGLPEASKEQREMVASIMAEGDDGWFDTDLRTRLASHAKEHGDLRYRHVQISDVRFDSMDSFFTEAFHGVFVLRSKAQTVLITVNPNALSDVRTPKDTFVTSLDDPELLETLLDGKFLLIDTDVWRKYLEILEDMRECLSALAVLNCFPDVPYVSLSEGKRKSLLAEVPQSKKVLLEEVESFALRLKDPQPFKKAEMVAWTRQFRTTIAYPNPAQHTPWQETLPLLVSYLRDWDPCVVYRRDKNRFVQKYLTWPDSQKEWAIQRILQKQKPKTELKKAS